MALTKCKECGATVSTNATACPGCGAKQGNGISGCLITTFILAFVFFVVMAVRGGGCSSSSRSASTPSGDVLLQNSSWDGSVYHVKENLKKGLKDPDSYESIEWSKVQKLDNETFSVRHKFRAKNSFGGFTIENHIYTYDSSGSILSDKNLGG